MDADDTAVRWLFPIREGRYDEVELAGLDPSDADDRRLLIESEHPELHEAIEAGRTRSSSTASP